MIEKVAGIKEKEIKGKMRIAEIVDKIIEKKKVKDNMDKSVKIEDKEEIDNKMKEISDKKETTEKMMIKDSKEEIAEKMIGIIEEMMIGEIIEEMMIGEIIEEMMTEEIIEEMMTGEIIEEKRIEEIIEEIKEKIEDNKELDIKRIKDTRNKRELFLKMKTFLHYNDKKFRFIKIIILYKTFFIYVNSISHQKYKIKGILILYLQLPLISIFIKKIKTHLIALRYSLKR